MKELQFDKKRKRVQQCPCGKSNADSKFVPFIGYDDKGYCHSCTRTFLPNLQTPERIEYPVYATTESLPSLLPTDCVELSMKDYESNMFTKWLYEIFCEDTVNELIQKYRIGTSDHWKSKRTTVFWFCDISNNCRSGKLMLYGSEGHRIKKPLDYCNWVHAVIKPDNFNFVQCFFGEHLLNIPENIQKTIIVVESEKSAIVASAYFPNYVWIACGGANGLTTNKCSVLEDRDVILYPDLGKFELWREKAEDLRTICSSIRVSDYLECNASNEDRANGFDIVDYLVKFTLADFTRFHQSIKSFNEEENSASKLQNELNITKEFVFPNKGKECCEDQHNYISELREIEEMEEFFQRLVLPRGIIRINRWAITNDVAICIERALFNARLTVGNEHIGHQCLERLRSIKKALNIFD